MGGGNTFDKRFERFCTHYTVDVDSRKYCLFMLRVACALAVPPRTATVMLPLQVPLLLLLLLPLLHLLWLLQLLLLLLLFCYSNYFHSSSPTTTVTTTTAIPPSIWLLQLLLLRIIILLLLTDGCAELGLKQRQLREVLLHVG